MWKRTEEELQQISQGSVSFLPKKPKYTPKDNVVGWLLFAGFPVWSEKIFTVGKKSQTIQKPQESKNIRVLQ